MSSIKSFFLAMIFFSIEMNAMKIEISFVANCVLVDFMNHTFNLLMTSIQMDWLRIYVCVSVRDRIVCFVMFSFLSPTKYLIWRQRVLKYVNCVENTRQFYYFTYQEKKVLFHLPLANMCTNVRNDFELTMRLLHTTHNSESEIEKNCVPKKDYSIMNK